MDWGKLRFFLGEVFANFTRNAGMQFTAIGTVAVTIVLLGSFLYVRETIQTFGTGVLSQIEIVVFLKDAVSDAKAKDLASLLRLKVDEIDVALSRIADGSYGRCDECFEAISKPRLLAQLPVFMCVSCRASV